MPKRRRPLLPVVVAVVGSGNKRRTIKMTTTATTTSGAATATSLWLLLVVLLVPVITMVMAHMTTVSAWTTPSCGHVTSLRLRRRIDLLRTMQAQVASKCQDWDPIIIEGDDDHQERHRLALLSFDLDDTLFPTADVVRDANHVMLGVMKTMGCSNGKATPEFFLDTTRKIRKSLDGTPITYRDLRKLTIRRVLVESSEDNDGNTVEAGVIVDTLSGMVEECYASWLEERHAAAERHLFSDAVETVKELRVLYPDTTIAAITNGAGDPLQMTRTLAPFFDFCISGEDDDVFPHRKPHPRIYEQALEAKAGASKNGLWIHLGDCLSNDVGASADVGAKAIWMCLEEEDEAAVERLTDVSRIPSYSTASKDEMELRALKVQAGGTKMAASIRAFSELPKVLADILQEEKMGEICRRN